MTVPISIAKLDPNCLIQGISRAMVSILRSGNVTVDVDYGEFARCIYVGVAGHISIVKWDGTTQVYSNVPVGQFWVASIKINSVGTTATNLVWGS